jgi:hypothetical protein
MAYLFDSVSRRNSSKDAGIDGPGCGIRNPSWWFTTAGGTEGATGRRCCDALTSASRNLPGRTVADTPQLAFDGGTVVDASEPNRKRGERGAGRHSLQSTSGRSCGAGGRRPGCRWEAVQRCWPFACASTAVSFGSPLAASGGQSGRAPADARCFVPLRQREADLRAPSPPAPSAGTAPPRPATPDPGETSPASRHAPRSTNRPRIAGCTSAQQPPSEASLGPSRRARRRVTYGWCGTRWVRGCPHEGVE